MENLFFGFKRLIIIHKIKKIKNFRVCFLFYILFFHIRLVYNTYFRKTSSNKYYIHQTNTILMKFNIYANEGNEKHYLYNKNIFCIGLFCLLPTYNFDNVMCVVLIYIHDLLISPPLSHILAKSNVFSLTHKVRKELG